jgi:hypothetical protein
LTLDAPAANSNRLDLGLAGGSAQTDLSGTLLAELEIDLATGVIGSLNLVGGDMVATGWSMQNVNLGPPVGEVDISSTEATATSATLPTPPATPPSAVTGTQFVATDQFIRLTSGTVTISSPLVPDENLAGTDIPGTGNGTITSTLNGDHYDVFFTMNIDDSQPISGVPLSIVGTIVARGTVTAIPEPSSAIALTALFAGFAYNRRRARNARG